MARLINNEPYNDKVESTGTIAFPIAVDTWGILATLVIPKGKYKIKTYAMFYENPASLSTSTYSIALSTLATATDVSDTTFGNTRISIKPEVDADASRFLQLPDIDVDLSSSTTYYMKAIGGNDLAGISVYYKFSVEAL